MSQAKPRPMVADADEDPNVTILCSSPPCFMHELDPSWLGQPGWEEVRAVAQGAAGGADRPQPALRRSARSGSR